MRTWLRKILSLWDRSHGPRHKPVGRSQLVGMYLSQANMPPGPGTRTPETRQRQNGKFSQTRLREKR
jgi:hypothetical protein